jgi:hypothetical protein
MPAAATVPAKPRRSFGRELLDILSGKTGQSIEEGRRLWRSKPGSE